MTTLDRITPIRELPIENKRVFIRVDFNVPLEEENGKMTITDDARIVEALPTIKHAMERGARVVLASHLGLGDDSAVFPGFTRGASLGLFA